MLMITTSRRWRIVAAAAIALLVPASAAAPAQAAPDDQGRLAQALKLQKQLFTKVGATALDDDPSGLPVAAGGDQSCAAGRYELFCWGAGDAEPAQPPSTPEAGPVTAGRAHQCVLASEPDEDDGADLYCWGDNAYGQLGDGTTTTRTAPVKVQEDVVQVAAGADHTCTVLTDHTVTCWGRDDAGQLGQGAAGTTTPAPAAVPGLTGIFQVAAGGDTTCVLNGDGEARCWGSNSDGQIGDGNAGPVPVPTPTPVDMSGLGSGAELMQIDLGARHTCAITGDEVVWCWGADDKGQLGDGAPLTGHTTPVDTGVEAAWMVNAGGGTTCAVDEDGQTWCWGDNGEGQLGTGDRTDRSEPAEVDQSGITGSSIFDSIFGGGSGLIYGVSVGDRHVCGMDVLGNPYCWGDNADGQIGDGTTIDRLTPTATLLMPGTPTGVDIQARDAEVGVDWSAPADMGIGDLSGYSVLAFNEEKGFGGCFTSAPGCTVEDLANGFGYQVFVTVVTTGGVATAEPLTATPFGAPSPAPVSGGGGGQLPITGAAISLLIAVGGAMIAGGMVLRRRARER